MHAKRDMQVSHGVSEIRFPRLYSTFTAIRRRHPLGHFGQAQKEKSFRSQVCTTLSEPFWLLGISVTLDRLLLCRLTLKSGRMVKGRTMSPDGPAFQILRCPT